MPSLTAQGILDVPMWDAYHSGENDEAISSQPYWQHQRPSLQEFYMSISLQRKTLFAEARRCLGIAMSLTEGWNTYESEPPNDTARNITSVVLKELEKISFPPNRLTASAEGGIALSFIEGGNRAIIEIYNTGEIAVATYGENGEPTVWELETQESDVKQAIDRIRVHIAA